MNETKPWWQSTTIWAALGAFLVTALPELGIGISDSEANNVVAGGFALAAIVGRLRAKSRIGADQARAPD